MRLTVTTVSIQQKTVFQQMRRKLLKHQNNSKKRYKFYHVHIENINLIVFTTPYK